MSKERVLVVAAHPDDESFGCLGMLLRHKKMGDKISFLSFTKGRDNNTLHGFGRVLNYFKDNKGGILDYKDQQLEMYPLTGLIKHIETMLRDLKPHIVYCPFIGDLNRDHRVVAEAVMVACRPYKKFAPREVLMYQIAGTTDIGLRPFNKDLSIPINPDRKVDLIEKWYPYELVSEREGIASVEHFERWPR